MSDTNSCGVLLSRIAELKPGDEILLGHDFYAEIEAVEGTSFVVRTEYGRVMRITRDAITAVAE